MSGYVSWLSLTIYIAISTGGSLIINCIPPVKLDPKPIGSGIESKARDEKEFEVNIGKGIKMKFCWISPGEANLGSPKEEQDYITKTFYRGNRPDWLNGESENKRGKFKTDGFWLGKYTVTQEQWVAVMSFNPSWFHPNGKWSDKLQIDKIHSTAHFPVERVSWFDAIEFCNRLSRLGEFEPRYDLTNVFKIDDSIYGASVKVRSLKKCYRLPSENEWEYACRGGRGNRQAYFFGNELNGTQANCNGEKPYGTEKKGDFKKRTSEVGSYAKDWPHPWGLCDIHGNVWQWCDDVYEQENYRIVRGGAWDDHARLCRSAYRVMHDPDSHNDGLGFRVCLTLD